MTRERQLQFLLRALGTLDLLAFFAVFLPYGWMAATHAWIGMGELPRASVIDYLARSASLMYAQHGAVFLYLSRDVRHYRDLIRLMAYIALISAIIMLGIDLLAGIPLFWTLIEGPGYVVLATTVLVLARGIAPHEHAIEP